MCNPMVHDPPLAHHNVPWEHFELVTNCMRVHLDQANKNELKTMYIKYTHMSKPRTGTTKIKKTTKNNTWYAEQYVKHSLIPFTITIGIKPDGRKDVKPPRGYNDIDQDNYLDHVDDSMNGMAIRTGTNLGNGYYLILIDIDNKETDTVKNGLTKWNSLIKNKEQINTPTQKTGNGGMHYLFKVPEKIFKTLRSSGTELEIDLTKYAIDFKGKNQFMIVEPSNYSGKTYTWITGYDVEIQEIPGWLIDIVVGKKQTNHKVENVDNANDNNLLAVNEYMIQEKSISLDELEQYVNILNKTRAEKYDKWLEIGFCLFNINRNSLYVWKRFSKQSKKYNEKECDAKWKTFRKNISGLKLGSMIYWLKQDNPTMYEELRRKFISQSLLNQHREKYTNTMEINTIHQNIDCNYVELKDTFCDIQQTHHENNDMYLEMLPTKFNMKCHNPQCRGKSICEHIKIPGADAKIVFNQFVQYNNYYNTPNDDNTCDVGKISLFDNEIVNDAVHIGFNGKPNPYAEIIYEYNKNKYVCTENDEWYTFENHHWNLLKGYNADLRRSFRCELKKIYSRVRDHYMEQEGMGSKTVKLVKQLIDNFDGTQLTDDIMKELKYIYMAKNKNFSQKLNSNFRLICFTNGVYDIDTHTFRDGRTDDYVSMCMGYNYTDTHTSQYPNLLKFLEDIQPHKEDREYLLTYISTALIGNTLELFTVLVGDGRNGKSKFIQLLEMVFGDYYDTMKSQMLTSHVKDGDSPSPALLSLANKRIVVASETLNGTKLNTGFIKFISGRDSVKHRMCHQNTMMKFSPNFVSLLVCNDIPDCDIMDNAFSKRLRCINFPTEFVDGKPNGPNQKQKDDNINLCFDIWKQDFFILLLDYYKKYEKNKNLMKPTSNVLKWTNQYKEDTDIYLSFLNECTENSDTHTKSIMLYDQFKKWFSRTNPKRLIPTQIVFSKGIKKHKKIERIRINDNVTSGIKNIRIKKMIDALMH